MELTPNLLQNKGDLSSNSNAGDSAPFPGVAAETSRCHDSGAGHVARASSALPGNMADTARTASPLTGKKRGQGSPAARPRLQSPSTGHSFRKVTLTKPTFCHSCSEFIWGLAGFLCEVCNFMSHEKCLKTLRSVCSCLTPSAISAPVAHCLVPVGHKKRFCSVCRKPTGGSTDLRCEVCELHVHSDCAVFSCADCRRSHLDTPSQPQDPWPHHWREGCASSSARCEVCRRSCGSSELLTGLRCEWCGLTVSSDEFEEL